MPLFEAKIQNRSYITMRCPRKSYHIISSAKVSPLGEIKIVFDKVEIVQWMRRDILHIFPI